MVGVDIYGVYLSTAWMVVLAVGWASTVALLIRANTKRYATGRAASLYGQRRACASGWPWRHQCMRRPASEQGATLEAHCSWGL